jgi:hypothetical protein
MSDAAIFVPNYKQVRKKEQVKVKVKDARNDKDEG